MPWYLRLSTLLGRVILGLYFFLAGIMKIQDPDASIRLMEDHGLPFPGVLLPLAIVVELAGGAALVLGFRARVTAFILAAFTLVVSVTLHNFWAVPSAQTAIELQLFYKNIGVLGGLLFVIGMGAGSARVSFGRFDLDD